MSPPVDDSDTDDEMPDLTDLDVNEPPHEYPVVPTSASTIDWLAQVRELVAGRPPVLVVDIFHFDETNFRRPVPSNSACA